SYYAGFVEFTTNDNDNALIDLRRIEQQASYNNIVPYLIANVLQRQGKTEELLRYITTLEGKTGVQNMQDIRLLGAEALFAKRDFTGALAGYQDYLRNKKNADRGVVYRAGYAHFSTSKFQEATDLFKQIASGQDSVGRYASYYLGISYLRLDQKSFALSAFQAAQSGSDDPLVSQESQYQEAKLLYDLMRPDEAIDRMEDFTRRYPDSSHSAEIGELLSGAYVNANNYRKAIGHIESMTSRSPSIDKAYQKATLYYGFEFFNKGEYPEAISWFGKSLQVPMDELLSAQAFVWTAEALAVTGKVQESTEPYERAIAIGKAPADVVLRARYGLGYVRYNLRQYDKALVSFREFVSRAPKTDGRYTDALIRLGDCFYVTKAYADAFSSYSRAFDSGKAGTDYALMQAGVVLGIQRKHKEGIALLDRMIARYPQSVYYDEAIFQRAQLEFEESNYQSAEAGYSQLIQSRPTSRFVPFAYVRRAASRFNLKAFGKTADDYTYVLKNFPGHPATDDILLPLQEALTLAGRPGDFDGLLKDYKQANPDAKGVESVEFESARNLYFNQEYQRAIASLSAYIITYPESPRVTEARYYRAEAFYRQKDLTSALRSYYEIADAVEFASASKVAARIGEIESKTGNCQKALAAYQRLGRLSSSPKEKFNSWAGQMDCHFNLSAYDSAVTYAARILADPGTSATLQSRAGLVTGKVWQAKGAYDEAKDEFLAVINNSQDEFGAEARYRLAEIQFSQGENRQCYESVISLNREYSAYTEWVGKGFLLLAESFLSTGEAFQAKATLRSLEKFPLESIRDEAQRRLLKIETAEARAKTTPSDTTQHE
ncbi:MAG: tetratricopeptide repeat protein, partial [Bacteroidota bacterium]